LTQQQLKAKLNKTKNIYQKQPNNMPLRKELSMKNKYIDTYSTVLYSNRTICCCCFL